jgi:hypothetical protein
MAAWVLIGLGGLLILNNVIEISGGLILIALGAAFLVGYANSRNYGLLVPGMILLGLGVGQVVEDMNFFDLGAEWGPFWLGTGFVGIYLVDRFTWKQSTNWPLWPGGILVLIGLWEFLWELEVFGRFWWDLVADWWPVALIIWGVYLLRGRRNRGDEATVTTEESSGDE